jgi:AraC-like DNA-binding protein
MTNLTEVRRVWHSINTAIAHFLHRAPPVHTPCMEDALTVLIRAMEYLNPPSAILDASLLQCLIILSPHANNPSSLLSRFVSKRSISKGSLESFSECVREHINHKIHKNQTVHDSIAIIEESYHDSRLKEKNIAARLGVRASTLSVAFIKRTGVPLHLYLRNTRLHHASHLLRHTDRTIKEVWSSVGYNFASNFDHDFKRHFGITPRAYRVSNTGRTGAVGPAAPPSREHSDRRHRLRAPGPHTVLIVDDDHGWRSSIDTYLRLEGFRTVTAGTADEAFAALTRLDVDAVLFDYHLLETDGITCIRSARERYRILPPIALLTADPFLAEISNEAQQVGAIVASKLCELDAIRQLVVSLLARGPA